MIKINLIRTIKGKDLIKEYEQKYGSLNKLKKEYEKDNENVELELDMDEWEYFKDRQEEELKQRKLIYMPKGFSWADLGILDTIKNDKPDSLTELAKLIDKDLSTVQKKITALKKEGLIELSDGDINNIKIPRFNYDKIEIAI